MLKKISRGAAIAIGEARGSLEAHIQAIRTAFYLTFPDTSERYLYVHETFDDHLIVSDSKLPRGQYWRVPYVLTTTADDGADAVPAITFTAEAEWELVELDYVPAVSDKPAQEQNLTRTLESAKPKGNKVRITEQVDTIRGDIAESAPGGPKRITIREALTAGVVNRNGRRYSEAVVKAAVDEIKQHLHESAGQGRAVLTTATGDPMVGEADHPSDKGKRPQLLETVVVWTDVSYDPVSRAVSLSGSIAETAKGKDILALAQVGLLPGGSLRGNGYSQILTENGQQIEEVVELHLTGYDLVLTPSFVNQSVLESRKDSDDNSESIPNKEQKTMDPKTLEALRKSLGLNESATEADIVAAAGKAAGAQKELAEKAAADAKVAAIDEAVKGLPYGDALNAQFKAELAEDAADAAAVPAMVAKLRKRYDAVAAQSTLKGAGFNGALKNIQVAPVFERETGQPAYAQLAHEFAESLAMRKAAPVWNPAKPLNENQRLASKMLEMFDKTYAFELQREAQQFTEAHTATDLALPYTVSRAINAAVFPNLTASSIFDVAPMQNSPEYLYYEAYTEESGLAVAVVDEVVTAPGTLGNWVSLAQQRLTPGTVVLTNSGGSTTYVENTDYFVDYANGAVFVPASGSAITTSQSLRIDYTYRAVRKGENVGIERAKNTLSRVMIEAKADRLAIEISNEAVVFGRSQLGYDVAGRAVANVVTEAQRLIDQGLIYMGLAAARSVASNTVSWTVGGTPDYAVGVAKLGQAKVKVANRNFVPTFALMSVTNSDLIANWTGFSASGQRPDGSIDANGFVGRVKGLDVFQSTQAPDSAVLVGNREHVALRIFQPILLKGPFPTYDANRRVVANDQWYIETFNATAAPVPQKGSILIVA
jgi:hypothetical protein